MPGFPFRSRSVPAPQCILPPDSRTRPRRPDEVRRGGEALEFCGRAPMHPVRNGNYYQLGLVVRAEPCATDERARALGPAAEHQAAPARPSLRAIDDAPPYAAH